MKEILVFFLSFIAGLTFFLLLVGFFKPTTALFWYKKPRTRKASVTIYGLTIFATILLCGFLAPPSTAGTNGKDGAKAPESVSCQVAKTENQGDDIYLKLTVDKVS